MKRFASAADKLGSLDVDAAATLVAAAADVALILDADGVVVDLALGIEPPPLPEPERWIGRPWIETVTSESRAKIEQLLADADDEPNRWRQINHLTPGGGSVAMQYCGFAAGTDGHVVVIGRDLQGIATLQQRLVETQQSLEQDYWHRRQVETRYRLLFQVASEAVLIVDAASDRILEANPSADQLFEGVNGGLVGGSLPAFLDEESRGAVVTMFEQLRSAGSSDRVEVHLAHREGTALLAASLLNQDGSLLYLVRMTPLGTETPSMAPTPRLHRNMIHVLQNGPDAVIITDEHGLVRSANQAFLELTELATEDRVRGIGLDRWVGRTNVDVGVLLRNLRHYGTLRHFATRVRGEFGADTEVEISAVTVRDGDEYCFGFVIRDVVQRTVMQDPVLPQSSPASVQQLTELVGRVPLKEVIRESSDIIERLCIEAALELTGDNRASAAEMLGLSRQSLYVKLRRHGLMKGDSD